MSYKTILVHLDHRPRSDVRLGLAHALAQEFDAHLVGLFAPGTARLPSYAQAEGGPLLRDLLQKRGAQILGDAEARFRKFTQRNGGERAEWRHSQSDPAAAVRRREVLQVRGHHAQGAECRLDDRLDRLALHVLDAAFGRVRQQMVEHLENP